MPVNLSHGFLMEYGFNLPPLVLYFEFNPQSITRTRTINITTGSAPGTKGGYGFTTPMDTPRVAQGVSVEPEKFDLTILLDATDRMADPNAIGHATAVSLGIEPELDTLRSMVEPKSQGPGGFTTLAALGLGGARAFQRDTHPSVLLLIWGTHILPVFLTSVQVEETAHLPSLQPYRANVTLSFQVIEGDNPFYKVEQIRQAVGAALNVVPTIAATVI